MSERDSDPKAGGVPNRSGGHVRANVKLGKFEAGWEAEITPAGLLAVGGLVAAIFLTVAPIVLARGRNGASSREQRRLRRRD